MSSVLHKGLIYINSSRHVGVGKVSTGGGQQYENCIYFRNCPMLCVGSL